MCWPACWQTSGHFLEGRRGYSPSTCGMALTNPMSETDAGRSRGVVRRFGRIVVLRLGPVRFPNELARNRVTPNQIHQSTHNGCEVWPRAVGFIRRIRNSNVEE